MPGSRRPRLVPAVPAALLALGCAPPSPGSPPSLVALADAGTTVAVPAGPLLGAPETGHTGEVLRDPLEVLTEGFWWAYPLVFTGRVLQQKPYDAFVWHQQRADERLDHVPNPDVIYGIGSVDLRAEPAVLHAADLLDRYWSVQLSDLYVESVAYVGTRTTGGLGGTWLVVPPGYAGDTHGLPTIEATTTRMVVLARLHVRDDADVPAVVALQPGYSLEPLSSYLGTAPPPIPAPPPVGGPQEETALDGLAFWDELGDALLGAPPRADEAHVLEGLAAFGIGPGRHPSQEVTDPAARALLEQAITDGLAAMAADVEATRNWVPDLRAGEFHGDLLHRAAWCSDGWVTHAPAEAVYARSPLMDGATPHVLRFSAEELPPVDAFWSLAIYREDGHLVANPWDRFSLQSTDPSVVYAPDGSLEIRLSPTDPGGPAANWLPVDPGARFTAFLRAYVPGGALLDGSWSPPPILAVP